MSVGAAVRTLSGGEEEARAAGGFVGSLIMDGRVWPHAVVPPCVSCCMISEQLWLVRWCALTQNGQARAVREGSREGA